MWMLYVVEALLEPFKNVGYVYKLNLLGIMSLSEPLK